MVVSVIIYISLGKLLYAACMICLELLTQDYLVILLIYNM